ncbi:MAG: ABC transporter permease [Chloroflexota bacterium]|nr:ABC transporter permease [Chloroflexota bacterium]
MNTTYPFFVILKRELRAVIKEKTIAIAFLIQLFIASFSSALFIGLMSFYDPDAIGLSARVHLRMGVIGDAESPLVAFLKEHNATVTTFSTPEDAESAFHAGEIDTAVFIPEVVPEDSGSVVDIKLFLPNSETHSTVVLMVLREPLKRYENYLRERNDIHLRYTDLEGTPPTPYEFRYAVIIPLLMFFPAFVVGGMVIDSISEELVNHTLETLWSAPLSLNLIFGAKIAMALVLCGVQCALWAALLRFNGIPIQNLGLILLLATVSATIIGTVSAFISVYFKDREQSQFMYSIFILLSTGLSYLSDASPIALMTRLATGDYYVGVADVALYGALLLVLLVAFFSTTKKLIAVPG